MKRSTSSLVLVLFASVNFLNALWMLLAPASWYRDLPAAVPDTGPLNVHFVRDIGAAFATMGAALLWAAYRPELRLPMLGLVTIFYGLHALEHAFDTVTGALPASHWAIDFPAVYLPAIALAVSTARLSTRR